MQLEKGRRLYQSLSLTHDPVRVCGPGVVAVAYLRILPHPLTLLSGLSGPLPAVFRLCLVLQVPCIGLAQIFPK